VLTTEQVCGIVDAACRRGYGCVQITGGEALLRSDIFEIIEHVHAKNMISSIQTNGVIGSDVMQKLVRLNPERVEWIVSLDGIQTHSHFRGETVTEKTVASIRKLSAFFPLRINTLLSTYISPDEITTIIDLASSTGASVAFNPLCPSGRGKECDMMSCSDYFAYMPRLQNYEGVCIRKSFEYRDGCFSENEDCPVRKGTAVFVSHNGDCYPCGFLVTHRNLCMGNLVALHYDLSKVFEHYPDACRKITAECLSCNHYLSKDCFAGCPARIFACNNTFDARESYCIKNSGLINL
jgi:MoaA/NifB/PqqE/SkfB family radical SAM enzyme